MTNHTLEKPNDWWQLHLALVNPLKSGPDSCHNAKGRPNFLHRERERALETPREQHTPFKRGLSIGPHTCGSCCHSRWSNKGTTATVFFFPLIPIETGASTTVQERTNSYWLMQWANFGIWKAREDMVQRNLVGARSLEGLGVLGKLGLEDLLLFMYPN